ncbi:methylesterase 10-like isoform X1 [Vitis riparia]|uniref:methylesterase 10-like isoform X1 n=1 Tax=Vitis riparia TaxID=96939 RepID=UPI00155AB213|nr:methylesterase 10-like isoform X1 [Vitis riparia]
MDRGKHFVLVHGAGHGAWCWYKLVPLLKLLGHRVTALDLGSSGVNPKRLDELASVYDYVQPLMELVASLPQDEKVVLVGHSYGGLPISLAMESFPEKILVAVFVSAYMPNYISPPITQAQEFFINRSKPESLLDSQLSFGLGLECLPTAVTFGPDYLSVAFYQHCQPEDLELAKSLVRPHGLFLEDFAKESLLSKEKFGSVDRVYVVLEKDEVMKEDFQRWVIDDSPPKEVKFIAGADHMVMMSRPKELCLCFQEIVQQYN